MDKNSSLKKKTLKKKTLKRKTLKRKTLKKKTLKIKKMVGGLGNNPMRLPLESNVSANGNGVQLGNDIINFVYSMINTITGTITTITDITELSSNMGSEFSSPFSPGA